MRLRSRDILLGVATFAALLSGVALVGWSMFGPGPSLPAVPARFADLRARVRELARAGQFPAAEDLVARYLKRQPADGQALLMGAELAIDRPKPDPNRALDLLSRVPSSESLLQAQVQLDRGKALYRLDRYDQAEAAWTKALEIDPTIPEAGWALLDLYYVQGRPADAHRLAMRLFAVEPDPHDRVHLLLELTRQDVEPSAPGSIVQWYEPVVRKDPGQMHASLALGLALVHDSRAEAGLNVLRTAVKEHPDSREAWAALCDGLGDANQHDELAQTVGRLPAVWADDVHFAKHRGLVAQNRRDWEVAAHEYRLAYEADPHDHEVLYRLSQALRHAGKKRDADEMDARSRSFESAREAIREVYNQANETPSLGLRPYPELCERLAELRSQMGRADEARAWRLIDQQASQPAPARTGPRA